MDAVETATVSVTLRTSEDTFGATGMWEASLYEGAMIGEEASGRRKLAWITIRHHQVRAAILDDDGVIISFMDSDEFTVE